MRKSRLSEFKKLIPLSPGKRQMGSKLHATNYFCLSLSKEIFNQDQTISMKFKGRREEMKDQRRTEWELGDSSKDRALVAEV